MNNYADYEFYVDEFKGSLSNDIFSFYIVKASRYIDRNINRKLTDEVISSFSEEEQDNIKYVACELVDKFYKEDNDANSISIDGVSISKGYYNRGNEDDDIKKNILSNLPHELIRFL